MEKCVDCGHRAGNKFASPCLSCSLFRVYREVEAEESADICTEKAESICQRRIQVRNLWM